MRITWHRKFLIWAILSSLFVFMLGSKTFATTEFKLLASDGTAGDEFGDSVSISGNLALVAATKEEKIVDGPGKAYVYDLEVQSGKAMPWIPLLLLDD